MESVGFTATFWVVGSLRMVLARSEPFLLLRTGTEVDSVAAFSGDWERSRRAFPSFCAFLPDASAVTDLALLPTVVPLLAAGAHLLSAARFPIGPEDSPTRRFLPEEVEPAVADFKRAEVPLGVPLPWRAAVLLPLLGSETLLMSRYADGATGPAPGFGPLMGDVEGRSTPATSFTSAYALC